MGRSAYLVRIVAISVARRNALLEVVLRAAEEESSRPFTEPTVAALRRAVPCDTVAYRAWSRTLVTDESYAADDLAERRLTWDRYPAFRHDDPHPSEPPASSGGPPPVTAARSLGRPLVLRRAVADRRFRQTGLYHELMRPFGVRDVMKVFLTGSGSHGSAFVFDTSGSGFDANDVAVAARIVPALLQLERNARLRTLPPRADERLELLTPRELTVLARVAAGERNAEIAAALFIGVPTVRKHLEHVYDKLGVRNRAAASAVYSRASPR
jgi:DNA-binding CsgD family transcriptional regulator